MDEKTELIRQRAYQIWLDQGQPEGQEQEHWTQAEREIEGRGGSAAPKSDSAGAFAPSQADSHSDGLASAEPKVLSGDGDATRPPDQPSELKGRPGA